MKARGSPTGGWLRHFVVRREAYRTTWTLRLTVAALVLLGVPLTRSLWTAAVAGALVCTDDVVPSDVLLIENFDPDYVIFERARHLRRTGIANRVLVPIQEGRDRGAPNTVGAGIAQVMAGIAHLGDVELLPIEEVEPISLNAARQILAYLQKEGLKSVVVVSPGFRSRRSDLVYRRVFEPAGIAVRCSPVFDERPPEQWADSWHGIQEAVLQSGKLLYYRFWVLL